MSLQSVGFLVGPKGFVSPPIQFLEALARGPELHYQELEGGLAQDPSRRPPLHRPSIVAYLANPEYLSMATAATSKELADAT